MGLAPGVRVSRGSLAETMRSESATIAAGAGLFQLRSLLIVVQVALCLPLLISAGLFLHSLKNLRGVDAGFKKQNVILASLNPALNGYPEARIRNEYAEVLSRVRGTSGVQSACLASYSPISGGWDEESVIVEGYQARDGRRHEPERGGRFHRLFPHTRHTAGGGTGVFGNRHGQLAKSDDHQ